MSYPKWQRLLERMLSDEKLPLAALAYYIQKDALKFGDFTFASGIKSNNKFELELLPKIAYNLATKILVDIIGKDKPDAVFGVPNGGNPIAYRVATRLKVPFIQTYKRDSKFFVNPDSPLINGRVYGFEDAMTSGGSFLVARNAVIEHANKNGYSISVPKAYAMVRRMEFDPDSRLKAEGVDLSYIYTTRDILGWMMYFYTAGIIRRLDQKLNELWLPDL